MVGLLCTARDAPSLAPSPGRPALDVIPTVGPAGPRSSASWRRSSWRWQPTTLPGDTNASRASCSLSNIGSLRARSQECSWPTTSSPHRGVRLLPGASSCASRRLASWPVTSSRSTRSRCVGSTCCSASITARDGLPLRHHDQPHQGVVQPVRPQRHRGPARYRHLRQVPPSLLDRYVRHYDEHRPHRFLPFLNCLSRDGVDKETLHTCR